MNEELEQSFKKNEAMLAIKLAYLKTLEQELQKLAESPETVVRIKAHADQLSSAYAASMIEDIEAAYKRRDNEIKRSGAKWRVILCPLISIVFSGVAWFNFARSNTLLGWEFVVFALAFVVMLVLGAIFDRPR